MQAPDIDECFRLLKLPRGADLARVKQAYRKTLYKCHPDRFQSRPDLLPAAEQKTKRLVQVYGILEKWYDDHGGMDPGSPRGWAGPETEAPEPDGGPGAAAEDVGSGLSRWAKIVGAVAAAASFVIFIWGFFDKPASIEPSPPPKAPAPEVAAPPPSATAQETPVVPRDPAAQRAAELAALSGARDRAKAEWVRAYTEARAKELAAAKTELAQAEAQYARDVQAQAAPIAAAEQEKARLLALAIRDSAGRRDAFARQAQDEEAEQRRRYDQWLLGKGGEAVALIQRIREREHSKIGVFSTTEDPAKIFEFWTAEEAGNPEINIAAKSGVTVRQPDSRYFPYFRTNINLYEPEGGVLQRMMEEIVEEHDALAQRIADRRLETETEVRNWEELHPPVPASLDAGLASILDLRDGAVERLAKAQSRVGQAAKALAPAAADVAFERSEKGRDFAVRIAAENAGHPKDPGAGAVAVPKKGP